MGTGYGREVIIDHGHGMETLYAHLSGFAVVAGQDVRRGDILGYVGSSGHSTGPHLHYEVRIHDTPVNPSKYLRAVPRQLASNPSTPTPASTATPASPTATGGGAD
jgi:murein DD-endopeptidase MepM/ murein hydrolase activator NlpD